MLTTSNPYVRKRRQRKPPPSLPAWAATATHASTRTRKQQRLLQESMFGVQIMMLMMSQIAAGIRFFKGTKANLKRFFGNDARTSAVDKSLEVAAALS